MNTTQQQYKAPKEACKACRERGKDWTGTDPVCAFLTGTFNPNNFACATMAALRFSEPKHYAQRYVIFCSDEQKSRTIPDPYTGGFIILGWYKNRGRTEYAGHLVETEIKPLTLETAERVIEGAYNE